MSQSSYMQDYELFEIVLQNNKRNKRQFDDGGYEENIKPKKNKPKKDFSQERQNKRGEFV